MLTPKEKALLKGAGNRLEASISLGKGGADSAFLKALDNALTAHGLVKVRLLKTVPDAETAVREMVSSLNAELVGQAGRVALIYRPSDNLRALKLEDLRK